MPPTSPILAAISFADPLMLAGFLAAAIPLALHLLNRIRSPIVPFPTLRFLKITAQKTSRRRQIQQYFLLLLRMAVFALIAMAIAHPLIRGGSASLAYGFLIALLLGLALLTLAAATALDRTKSRPAQTDSPSAAPSPRSVIRHSSFVIPLLLLLAAIALTGFAAFGLTSNAFFSGDAGTFSGRSTAVVFLFDNSHSMLARREGTTRLDAAKKELRRLLVDTLHPAEAAILATNPPTGAPAAENLTTDTTALLGYLDHLEPSARARPTKQLLRTAADLLARSSAANKMLILLSDLAGPAYADPDLFSTLKQAGMQDVQIVLLPPGGAAPAEDVGIASFTLAEGAPVLGSEVTFEAQLLNNADTAAAKDWELLIDNHPAPNAGTIQLNPAPPGTTAAARATLRIPYRLAEAGDHTFALHLKDTTDAMEWDDTRTLVLHVAGQARVLLLGPDPTHDGPRPRSAAFFLQAALAPFEGADGAGHDAAGKPIPWSIKPEYRSINDITSPAPLAGNAAIFLCDIPRIPPRAADALQKYITASNARRLVWILGPSIDPANYNAVLLPRNLLPAPLKDPLISATGATLDWVDLRSHLFANLFDNEEPFRTAVITGRWSIAPAANTRTLARLSDASPLLLEHAPIARQNAGDIYTLLTSPGAAWSNLGSTVLMVPLASRLALGDAGRTGDPVTYDSGDTVPLHAPASDTPPPNTTLDVTAPNNSVINVRPVPDDNTTVWPFAQTQLPGIYHWRSPDAKLAGLFAVNPPAEEVDLHPASPEELAREAAIATKPAPGRAPIVAASADDLLAQLDKRSEGTSLTPGVLAMVMILAVIEALLANRYRPAAPVHAPPLPSAAPAEPAAPAAVA